MLAALSNTILLTRANINININVITASSAASLRSKDAGASITDYLDNDDHGLPHGDGHHADDRNFNDDDDEEDEVKLKRVFKIETQEFAYEAYDGVHHAEAAAEAEAAAALLSRGKESAQRCESLPLRHDVYAEAAERGSAEALYLWAMIELTGSESPSSNCGYSAAAQAKTSSMQRSLLDAVAGQQTTSSSGFAVQRAVLALAVAASRGHAAALVPLSTALLTGAGVSALALDREHDYRNGDDADDADDTDAHHLYRALRSIPHSRRWGSPCT